MIQEIIKKAKSENKKVYIYAHKFPDGDAISSSCAIQKYLQNEGIDAKYVVTNEIRIFKEVVGEIPTTKSVEENAISIILDTSTISYAENAMFKKTPVQDIYVIDHHEKVKDTKCIEDELGISSKNVIRNKDSSSTCEIITSNLEQEKITPEIANMLLLGLLTDTAKLRYIRQDTLKNLAKLIECNANYENITNLCNRKINLKEEVGIARTLLKVRTFKIGETFGMILPVDNKETNNLSRTYGIRNLQKKIFKMADIRNCSFMCMLAENTPNKYDVEFRSAKTCGNFDVSILGPKHNGGGHEHASGGFINIEEGETQRSIEEQLKQEAIQLYSQKGQEVQRINISNEDKELSRILNRTKRFTKGITPEILMKAQTLVENGANYEYIFKTAGITPKELMEEDKPNHMIKIERNLKTFRIQNEILSRIPYSVYSQRNPSVNIKLSGQDIEILTKKYKVTQEEILSAITVFSNINIESATITLPDGKSVHIDKNGNTTKQEKIEKEVPIGDVSK